MHTGYGSVAALHDVVSGGPTVFRLAPGDPHPVAYLRVLLGVQMCVRFFGAGPWDDLGRAWVRAYPLSAAPPDARELAERSVPLLPRIAELCLLTPMRAFGGRPIVALVDPLRVRPDALEQLERDAGGALTTSSLLDPRGGAAPARADELPLGDRAGAVGRDREAIRELDAAPGHAVGGRGVNGERRGGRGE